METNVRRLLLGAIFILLGAAFLLDNLNIWEFQIPHYLFRWEMILVLIGILNLFSGRYAASVVLFGVAAFLWVLRDYDISFWDLWPVILIIIGLGFIFRQSRNRPIGRDSFDDMAIFGGNEKVVTSHNFKGGKATSIFGGSVIDLRKCQLGENPVIDVFTMFGGCEIKVPEDWEVRVDVMTILGGFEDKRRGAVAIDDSKTLIVKGFTMFGGGEIKN